MLMMNLASMMLSWSVLFGLPGSGPPAESRVLPGPVSPPSEPHFSGPSEAGPIERAEQADAEVANRDEDGGAEGAETAEELLERLEEAAGDLHTFTAEIIYENWDDFLERREIRQGEIIYQIDPDTDAKNFAILFESLTINQRRQTRLRHYVFRDRWLAEIDHEAKQFIKRELVPPGRQLDPLKLGEGPVPLPIGQPKEEVLKRFEVSLIDPPGEEIPLLRGLKNVDGLRLVPREGTPEAKEYQRIELYYDRTTNLPVGINVIEINDDRKTVRLGNLQRNPELTDTQTAKLSIDEPDPRDWSIDIRPLG